MGEYEACIICLHVAFDLKIEDLEAYKDLILIISHATGEWAIKSPELAKHHKCPMHLKGKFQSISFLHVSWSRNHFTDALATLALMLTISDNARLRPVDVETRLIRPIACVSKKNSMVSRGIMTWKCSYNGEFTQPMQQRSRRGR